MHSVLVTCFCWRNLWSLSSGLGPVDLTTIWLRIVCNGAQSVSIPIWTVLANVLLFGVHAFLLDAHASCCYVSSPRWARSRTLCIHVMMTIGLFHGSQSIPLVLAFVMASIMQHVTVDAIRTVPASCLCHNGDYPGTHARSCLIVDELLVGHLLLCSR